VKKREKPTFFIDKKMFVLYDRGCT